MVEISEQITRVTTSSDTSDGARVTLGFSRSVPLAPGQVVRLQYDLAEGRTQECVGIAQPTHTVARRGEMVVFHYRLSHWISNRGTRASIASSANL